LAHPLDPALLELREHGDGRFAVLFQTPLPILLQPILPEGCRAVSAPQVRRIARRALQRWEADCGAGSLIGRRIGIEGLRARGTDAVLRIELRDGGLIESVLRPDQPVITVAAPARMGAIAADYFGLGLAHILGGLDHLLFVLGLVLLVTDRRTLLWTITAFTLGHSVTLALAVLGFVHVPPSPIEALIALSIVAVAAELARTAPGRARQRGALPATMALGFGMLHGLGFAGALAEVGLPAGEIPLALFAFNCGIEVGQLMFVAIVLVAAAAVRSLPIHWPAPARLAPAYAIGSLAAYWAWQRLLAML
jgi:hydrogenase/urease accessory protein HupE